MMRPNLSRRPPRGLRSALLHILGSIAAVCVLSSSAQAVTLDDAVRAALAGNLDLRAAKYEVEKARGRLIQAGLWPNPELEFSGRTDRAFSSEGERTLSVGFAQAFPITGRLRFARQVRRVDVAQAMVEIRNRERRLIGEVQRDYLTAFLLQRQIAATVVRLRLEAGLDRSEPLIRKFLEADVSILLALGPLGLRAEFHQPPLGNREVVRLERAPDLLAVDLDEGVVKSNAVPVEALGDLVKLLRFFRHLIHAKEQRVT